MSSIKLFRDEYDALANTGKAMYPAVKRWRE